MLLTRECDYAIRIMRALDGGEIINVQEICRREDITVPVAYKLTRKLEKSGCIQSHRGSSGGYSLSREMEEVTLYDICTAVDQELFINKCTSPEGECSRNTREHPCTVHQEMCRLQEILTKELRARSLREILDRKQMAV